MVKQTKRTKQTKLNKIKRSKKVKNLKKTVRVIKKKTVGGGEDYNEYLGKDCEYYGFSSNKNNLQISEVEKLIREKTIIECKRDKLINTTSTFNYKNRTNNIVNFTQQILNIENKIKSPIKSPIEQLQKEIKELENLKEKLRDRDKLKIKNLIKEKEKLLLAEYLRNINSLPN